MSNKHKMRTRRLQLGTAANLNNSLNEALFPSGMGFNQNVTFGQQQVSKTNELFADMRGYMVSNMRQLLSQSYVEIGLIQAMVNIPIDDAFKGGINIVTQQLSPHQITQLKNKMGREGDLLNLAAAMKWDRLFGGSGLIIVTDQDPTTKLDIKSLKPDSVLEFKDADLWELFYNKENIEGFNPAINDVKFEYYSYYGKNLHRSRVFKFKGIQAPSFIRPRLRGWGMSVVEILIRAINQYLKGTNLIYELLDEAKLDVYGLKDLAGTLLSQGGTQLVQQRVAMANRQKNFQNAIVLDAEDKYEQKAFTFTGIADVMKEIRVQVASDLRMPMTKVFGLQSSGFSDDEGSIENYNSMVESTIREQAKYDVVSIIELRCQQLFSFIPTDLEIEFKPLRTMKATEEDTVKTGKFNRLLAARTAGEISSEEFRDACTKDNLLVIPLTGGSGSLSEDTDDDAGETKDGLASTPGANVSPSENLNTPESKND